MPLIGVGGGGGTLVGVGAMEVKGDSVTRGGGTMEPVDF